MDTLRDIAISDTFHLDGAVAKSISWQKVILCLLWLISTLPLFSTDARSPSTSPLTTRDLPHEKPTL